MAAPARRQAEAVLDSESSDDDLDDDEGAAEGKPWKRLSAVDVCGSLAFGVIVLIVACVLIGWNEARAIRMSLVIEASVESVVEVSCDTVDPRYDGMLVHLSCAVSGLRDFGVLDTQVSAIFVETHALMWQWVELTGAGSATSGRAPRRQAALKDQGAPLAKEWVAEPVDSRAFERAAEVDPHNPPASAWPVRSGTAWVPEVRAGAYALPMSIVRQRVKASRGVDLAALGVAGGGAVIGGPELSSVQPPSNLTLESTALVDRYTLRTYEQRSAGGAPIGAMRVGFRRSAATTLSVLGRQRGASIERWEYAGFEVLELAEGEVSAGQMFDRLMTYSRWEPWFWRCACVALAWIGLEFLLYPLTRLARSAPALEYAVGKVLNCGISAVGLVLALAWCCLIAALAWIYERPTVGITLFVLTLLGLCTAVAVRGLLSPGLPAGVPEPLSYEERSRRHRAVHFAPSELA